MSSNRGLKSRPQLAGLLWGGLIVVMVGQAAARPAAADRLILRDLKIISGRKVVSWDEDGVRLDDKSLVSWGRIERGSVDADRQAAFDKMLKELGGPLFQIRQRLIKGDYPGLLQPAEAIYPRYKNRDSQTAYMVLQALMWSRLAEGRRAAALEPYLLAYTYLQTHRNEPLNLPGERRLRYDPRTAISAELPPVWFDQQAAKAAMPDVFAAVSQMRKKGLLPAGARIYYATLALTAGESDLGLRVLEGIQSQERLVNELRAVVLAQEEIQRGKPALQTAQLEASWSKLSPASKPLALYWLGTSKSAAEDEQTRRQGVLQLLRLPALYGEQHPELAAAALYRCMNVLAELDDPQGSVALRRELLVRYGQTSHASSVKSSGRDTKTPMR